jgi:hypothetical protein
MSILVECVQCGAKDRVGDEHAGKAILCKACHAPMVVPSAGDAGEAGIKTAANGGARRTRNWGDEEEKKAALAKPKARRSPAAVIVAVVLALSCVLCTGVGSIAAWWALSDEQLQPRPRKNVNRDGFVNEGPMNPVVNGDNGLVPPGVGPIVLERQGRLLNTDAKRDGKPHQTFAIGFEQGKTYVIDMRSVEMDSYLWLNDPNGIQVALDDDSGGNQNARIRHTATQTGDYVIAATVFSSLRQEGAAFTLTVRAE